MKSSDGNTHAKGDARQDQELSAALEWFKAQPLDRLLNLFDAINEGTPDSIRGLPNECLEIIRSLSLIAFYDVARRNHQQAKGEHK